LPLDNSDLGLITFQMKTSSGAVSYPVSLSTSY